MELIVVSDKPQKRNVQLVTLELVLLGTTIKARVVWRVAQVNTVTKARTSASHVKLATYVMATQ